MVVKKKKMRKFLNIGKVKLEMHNNGFPKGFILKRKLNLRECRYILSSLLGINILKKEDFEYQEEYNEYNNELCNDVNNWLVGDADDYKIAEYAWDCPDEFLGMFNMLTITQYLIKKGII